MKEKEDFLTSLDNVDKSDVNAPKRLTVLPLRDIVIFPNMIFPVLIGRSSSLKAVSEAVERDKFIFVSAQRNPEVEEPGVEDIYRNGTISKIIQIMRLPNNLLKVLIDGLFQAKIKRKIKNEEFMEANVEQIEQFFDENDRELQALVRHTSEQFTQYVRNSQNLPPDMIGAFENIEDPVKRLFYAASNLQAKVETKQKLLEENDLKKQYFELSSILTSELEMLNLENEIDSKVHDQIQKTQKKFYIQEQIRALQKELGEEEGLPPELQNIKKAIDDSDMPEEVYNKAMEEFEKLKKTPSMSPEFSVNRNYLETLSQVPWRKRTDDNLDIEHVRKILDEDHYDLEKPKDRILEFIAVLNLTDTIKRQILCFVGPPGVGKTSLAKSIARALGRNFVRFSLGGIRDEAEIRGHRRTYIGSMPGKIIQSMKRAGTVNPVILLDEVDKMSMDFRGDPSSALLEVLDPEQNVAFNDHYLEVDYDLSNVMFITTANVRYDIPLPLQDRMEIIDLNSYLDPQKLQIAKRHLILKLLKEYGLENFDIDLKDEAVMKIIREYTREAGVRQLERTLASVFRKLAKDVVSGYDQRRRKKDGNGDKRIALYTNPNFKRSVKNRKFVIDADKIEDYLKAPKFKDKHEDLEDKIGVAMGLSWTSVGGATLPIEVTFMPGNERLTLTGKLGEVMKESATAALSYIRSNYKKLDLPENFNKKKEIHVHVPEGAIPKDGPSAGLTMALALISAAAKRELRGDIAMTGEITLRGQVLPVGGLNEKLLAAKKAGIKDVLVPADNKRDIEDIDNDIKEELNIIPVKNIDEAHQYAFRNWKPNSEKEETEN